MYCKSNITGVSDHVFSSRGQGSKSRKLPLADPLTLILLFLQALQHNTPTQHWVCGAPPTETDPFNPKHNRMKTIIKWLREFDMFRLQCLVL